MDARQRRSQESLHRAIIDLATERAVSGLTVSDITDRAGVNRSTFYAHAASAAELLTAALSIELDVIRVDYLARLGEGDPADASNSEATVRILDHLERHRSLYLGAFDDAGGDSGLRVMLAGHFRRSVNDAVASGAVTVPQEGFLPGGAAAYISAGSAALMEEWLRLPDPRDPDLYLDAFAQVLPPWWPLSSSASAVADA
ncbi:TetR/AcrR family transcriptional regulator [Rathayibacter sp. SD072]|uniref:TetR/AcrR family transcriptional regulator n=1 Tax=Rathayibacter sp. SD072 TaxID=2781731 RepID=UPI001A961E98|nr:TetR/AcrR family transcriptional regulator [Rathayibacter sp. SD072]MBO0984689.1 TetR/AcrR family transcriptional regulator [Rathayibacter sp. SD072]